jgi:hypothetical protein
MRFFGGLFVSTIHATISPTILSKADRLFRNDDEGVFAELLQNARRAGASRVEILVEQFPDAENSSKITFHDNGSGIDDFQTLLTLGGSDWSAEVREAEDPAGMGFFSLCHSEVEVASGDKRVVLSREAFLGTAECTVVLVEERIPGTRIVFTRVSNASQLLRAAARVSEFCPMEVFLNGELVDRHDFLEGALYREVIDGIEVGFATAFRWNHEYKDDNWNFYGLRIHEPYESIPGVLRFNQHSGWGSERLVARFNVLEVGRVKLQLPDRRAIVQDQRLREFELKARAAAYRFFQTEERHLLPFTHWKEAQTLGVVLPEASSILRTWHAAPADDGLDPFFGTSERTLLATVDDVLLVNSDLPNQHTLEAALQNESLQGRKLYTADAQYQGYSWYDALPRLTSVEVVVDDVSFVNWQTQSLPRPEKIELLVALTQTHQPDSVVRLPATIHVVDGDDLDYSDGSAKFVAVRNSPWDNDNLDGPFDVVDFLLHATFLSSDDAGADSWDTQQDYHQGHIEHEVNLYFRGPQAALLALLQDALSWDMRQYANQVGVTEIRFLKPGTDERSWRVELSFETS